MDIVIRTMKKEDWEAVVEIFQEGINIKTATFHREIPAYEVWDSTHIKSCRFVAEAKDHLEEQGLVVGWVSLTPFSSRLVYAGVAEVSIYVRNGYRGKGVGEQLLQTIIEESEKEGFWTLQSGILEINNASRALHEKLGFRLVGYRERIAQDANGVWQNTILMERRSKFVGTK